MKEMLRSRLLDPRPQCHRRADDTTRLIRFGTVGLFATGIYFTIIVFLHQHAGVSVPEAATASFVLVAAMNYLLHYFWTFRSHRSHVSAVPRFIGTSVSAMAINYGVVALGIRWLALPQTVILLVGIVLVVIWNYLMSRFWVFAERA
jgi:putative flippase GtrA